MQSAAFNNYETGPWWAFLFFTSDSYLIFFEATADINTNLMIYFLNILLVAIATWQITRLQIKANEYMMLSKESENVIGFSLKKWEIVVLLLGFVLGFFSLIGTIFPLVDI